ncbi:MULTISPECIES: hypothetical protein [Eubacteriales]|uniref:lipopolysaccharide biosynthesis protein n=1 Tax=Eubacteriales TaxID=186802 RepID=UPI0011067D88|nr:MULTISPECIES: hypothetical protein [Eubacteriales]
MASNFSKSVKNIVWTSICQITTLLMSFISRSIFIHFLSAEYLGVNGLFSNILTLLSFSELGIGNVIIYTLYEPIKTNNYQKINALLTLYKKAYRIIASVMLGAGILITPFIEYLIKDKPTISEDIHLLFLLYLGNTVVSYLCTYKKSMLLADQKAYINNLVTNIAQITLMIVQCIVLYLTHSFILYLVCQIICTFLINVILTIIVNKQYPHILSSSGAPLSKEEKHSIFINIKALAISKISGVVANGTANIIISKMFGLISVGLTANYTMVTNSVNNIFYNALTSISSSIGNFNVDSNVEAKRRIFDELFMAVYLLYSFVCVCLTVLLQPFIVQWLGQSYLMSFFTVVALVLSIYVGGINYPIYAFRTTHGYFREVQYTYMISAIMNIILAMFFGKAMGVGGVFFAISFSKLFITEVADSYYTYKKILRRKHVYYLYRYLIFFALLVVNTIICFGGVSLISLSGWIGVFVKGAVCAILNILVNIVFFAHRWEFKDLVARYKKLVLSRRK